MEKLLSIGSAFVDLGEHDFLQHLTHEVKINDKVIGHVLITAYNFKKAAYQDTAWRWLAKPNSYLSKYKDYLFNTDSVRPELPDILSDEITDSDTLIVIDEITLDPKYQGYRLESYVLTEVVSIYLDDCEVILLGDYLELTQKMGYDKSLSAVMYCQLGFVFIDNFLAVKYKSIGTDSLDEIGDLKVEMSQFIV